MSTSLKENITEEFRNFDINKVFAYGEQKIAEGKFVVYGRYTFADDFFVKVYEPSNRDDDFAYMTRDTVESKFCI